MTVINPPQPETVIRPPSADWRMLSQAAGDHALPRGADAVWDRLVGWIENKRPRCRRFLRRAAAICETEKTLSDLSEARLRERIETLRQQFRLNRARAEQVDEAYALIREVSARQVGMRPYPVQVAAALAMEDGCIVELATGEGKTLSATMPVVINGWRGRGCHVVTFNDYLAQRDAEWMGPVYRFCGLSVASIHGEMPPDQRRAAYHADITYVSNKEVIADYLRDRLGVGPVQGLSTALLKDMAGDGGPGLRRTVMRGLAFCLVDEADSILVDEAVTPLIISGQAPNDEQVATFNEAAEFARQLTVGRDYRVNQRYREVELSGAGKKRVAELTAASHGVWRGRRRSEELITQALSARELYHRDKQYVVDEGKIVIVDEFTGRLMPDRTWREGLHQAVEAKEGLEVNPPKDTYARLSFQRFFRMYPKLAGMTGTAWEARSELWQIYHRPIVRIPTHRPCIRQHQPSRYFADQGSKWEAVVEHARRLRDAGRAVLIGTRNVRNSEQLSVRLTEAGLEHQVLNAVLHRQEAQIVAEAGQPGRITVATNMAGRGTDIKLGRGVSEAGGLAVIATDVHESGRIDRQLFGRAARQGDPGSAVMFVSLDDEVIVRHCPWWIKRWRAVKGRFPVHWLVNAAQRKAEHHALFQRKNVLKHDHWLDENLGFAGREG